MRSVRFLWQTARRLLVCVAVRALGLSSARSHDDIVRWERGHGLGKHGRWLCARRDHEPAASARAARLEGRIPADSRGFKELQSVISTQLMITQVHKALIPQNALSLSLSTYLCVVPLALSAHIATTNEPQRHAGLRRGTHRPHFRRYLCCTYSAACFDWATLNVTPSLTRPGTWRQKEMWGTDSMPSRPNLYLLMPMPMPR